MQPHLPFDLDPTMMKRNSRRRVIANTAIDLLLLPLTCCVTWWARSREKKILCEGQPLTVDQLALARAAGVVAPQRVRVMAVSTVPMPLPQWLRRMAERAGGLSPQIAGMTLGYGIVLRGDVGGDHCLLAHELAHVAQYERFERVERFKRLGPRGGFMREYVRECVWPGYPHGPLEIEAQQAARAAHPPARQPAQVRGECDTVHGCQEG